MWFFIFIARHPRNNWKKKYIKMIQKNWTDVRHEQENNKWLKSHIKLLKQSHRSTYHIFFVCNNGLSHLKIKVKKYWDFRFDAKRMHLKAVSKIKTKKRAKTQEKINCKQKKKEGNYWAYLKSKNVFHSCCFAITYARLKETRCHTNANGFAGHTGVCTFRITCNGTECTK